MDKSKLSLRPSLIVELVLLVVVLPFMPLVITGRWSWWGAWAYGLLATGGFIVSRVLAARRHPDLLAERSRYGQHENVKPWDRRLTPLILLGSGLIPLAAGLEMRFAPSPPGGEWLKIAALLTMIAGYALSTYALMENRYFSANVRIQVDREHQVVTSGPYRWVRHPGYVGGLLGYLATPLLLDSRWAWPLVLLLGGVTVLRTSLEDRTLQEELPGYREYAGRVRYRLLPGVW